MRLSDAVILLVVSPIGTIMSTSIVIIIVVVYFFGRVGVWFLVYGSPRICVMCSPSYWKWEKH